MREESLNIEKKEAERLERRKKNPNLEEFSEDSYGSELWD